MISNLFLINENHGVYSWDPATKTGGGFSPLGQGP